MTDKDRQGLYEVLDHCFAEHLKHKHSQDITLRDQFAMAALPALIGESTYDHWKDAHGKNHYAPQYELIAKQSYAMADAMLKARGDN